MTLTRASEFGALESTHKLGKLIGGKSVSTRDEDELGNVSELLLKQRFRELDISTTFVSDEEVERRLEAGRPLETARHWTSAVNATFQQSQSRDQATSTCDTRQFVLEAIGSMFDQSLLSESETAEAIGLAMKLDATFSAMASLLHARKTQTAQSAFLKLWLNGHHTKRFSPSPILPERSERSSEIFRPKPIHRMGSRETSAGDSHSFEGPSPPLMPIALQFGPPESPPLVFAPVQKDSLRSLEYLV